MRYLHPVQGHEKFIASGIYKFFKEGVPLHKTEEWTIHEHPDGERFIRVDMDARAEEGKSILLEALQAKSGDIVRFDVRYENSTFDGGVKSLRATFSIDKETLQVGFEMNGADRDYREIELPRFTLIDIPLLAFRGQTTFELARNGDKSVPMFVPMFDFAQLFPGVVQMSQSNVEYVTDETIPIGKINFETKRYRYPDKAMSYWVDKHNVVIKRVNAFKQKEFVVQISNYANQR